MKKITKKHSIYILTLAIIMIVFSGCSLINTSPSSKGGSDELQEAATSSQEGLNNGSEENDEARNEEDSDSNEIDTSEWKTYRNEEYGFEIKYPGDWKHDTLVGEFYRNTEYPKMGIIFYNSLNNANNNQNNESIILFDQGWFDVGDDLFERKIIDFDKEEINDFIRFKEISGLNNLKNCNIKGINCLLYIKAEPANFATYFYIIKLNNKFIVLSFYADEVKTDKLKAITEEIIQSLLIV